MCVCLRTHIAVVMICLSFSISLSLSLSLSLPAKVLFVFSLQKDKHMINDLLLQQVLHQQVGTDKQRKGCWKVPYSPFGRPGGGRLESTQREALCAALSQLSVCGDGSGCYDHYTPASHTHTRVRTHTGHREQERGFFPPQMKNEEGREGRRGRCVYRCNTHTCATPSSLVKLLPERERLEEYF